MKTKLFLLTAILLLSQTAKAGTTLTAVPAPSPSVVLTWTLSPTVGVTSQNVYRAPCTGTVTGSVCSTDSTAVFTKLAAGINLAAAATTFTDTTVVDGQAYIYYVTAFCPIGQLSCSGESLPSNHAAAAVPGGPPQPPSGVVIGSVTATVNGANKTVVARWTDTNAVGQYFSFTDGTKFLNQGLTSSLTGSFAEEVVVPATTTITFFACDATGSCASQVVN
jgi:hypothetical protein